MRKLSVSIVFAALTIAAPAGATGVTEFPDNGSEQFARGGAWIARASDPLAAFYNPAGLAGQDTRLTLNANLNIGSTCFTRIKAASDSTQDGVAPGASYGEVCADGHVFPNPQLGFTYRASDRLGLSFLVLGPSSVGKHTWPEFVERNGQQVAAPQRYMLLDSEATFLTPTIAAGYEVADGIRFGASFQWGIVPRAKFSNSSYALNTSNHDPQNDILAELRIKDMFVPGATVGTLISPTDNFDIAAWYKWSAPIEAKGDVTTYANYFTPAVARGDTSKVAVGDSSLPDCGFAQPQGLCGPDSGSVKLPIPMEAKIGARFHQPRQGETRRSHRRDPLAQDVFDVELNLTWANNSTFDALQIRFPSDSAGNGTIPVNGTGGGGRVPGNADVPHGYKDVFGVRFGGDYNLLPDKLAVRAGVFYESNGQDKQFQSIDFAASSRFGMALGGMYRVRFHQESKDNKSALEIHLGLGHVFYATQENTDPNAPGLNALAGSPTNPDFPNGPRYRSAWPINLGTIKNSLNVINVGLSYRF